MPAKKSRHAQMLANAILVFAFLKACFLNVIIGDLYSFGAGYYSLKIQVVEVSTVILINWIGYPKSKTRF